MKINKSIFKWFDYIEAKDLKYYYNLCVNPEAKTPKKVLETLENYKLIKQTEGKIKIIKGSENIEIREDLIKLKLTGKQIKFYIYLVNYIQEREINNFTFGDLEKNLNLYAGSVSRFLIVLEEKGLLKRFKRNNSPYNNKWSIKIMKEGEIVAK